MFSVAPNIALAPNMTQNAERKHRTQDANTAHIRPLFQWILLGGKMTLFFVLRIPNENCE